MSEKADPMAAYQASTQARGEESIRLLGRIFAKYWIGQQQGTEGTES
jgi:hypothetical protein